MNGKQCFSFCAQKQEFGVIVYTEGVSDNAEHSNYNSAKCTSKVCFPIKEQMGQTLSSFLEETATASPSFPPPERCVSSQPRPSKRQRRD